MRTAEAAMFQALSRLAAVCCAKASSRRTETPLIPVHGPEMLRQLSQCSDSCHCPLDLGILQEDGDGFAMFQYVAGCRASEDAFTYWGLIWLERFKVGN